MLHCPQDGRPGVAIMPCPSGFWSSKLSQFLQFAFCVTVTKKPLVATASQGSQIFQHPQTKPCKFLVATVAFCVTRALVVMPMHY